MPSSSTNPFGVSSFLHGLAKILFRVQRLEDGGDRAPAGTLRGDRCAAHVELGRVHHVDSGSYLSGEASLVPQGRGVLLPTWCNRPLFRWYPDRPHGAFATSWAKPSCGLSKATGLSSRCRRKRRARSRCFGRPGFTTLPEVPASPSCLATSTTAGRSQASVPHSCQPEISKRTSGCSSNSTPLSRRGSPNNAVRWQWIRPPWHATALQRKPATSQPAPRDPSWSALQWSALHMVWRG